LSGPAAFSNYSGTAAEAKLVELESVKFLHSVGGFALNRNIYKYFRGDKAVDAGMDGGFRGIATPAART
jgi:hypothetical protein